MNLTNNKSSPEFTKNADFLSPSTVTFTFDPDISIKAVSAFSGFDVVADLSFYDDDGDVI